MKKTEILKLSPYCFPEQISSSHLTQDLNKAFDEAGFHTTVYAPTPCRGIDDATREKYKKIKHEQLENGSIDIYRFPLFKEGRNPVFRAIRYVLCNCIQYFKGIRAKGVDLVYAGSTPPTQGLLCGKVARKLSRKYGRKVPFIYNLQDIFPDSLVNAKMTAKGSIVWKIGRKIEDYAYRSADRIITISEDFKANIMAKGVPEEKIKVIPNWVNTENVYPVDRKDNLLFDRYNLDRNLFYICYSGNIGHSQNMELLLSVAQKTAEEMPSVRFVLIGEGAAKEDISKRIEAEQIPNVIMMPFQDYEDISHVFSLGDVGLIISKPGVGGSSVPSKTWSILAAGRPVLASFDQNSELAKLIVSSQCGVVSDAGDEEALLEGIRELLNNSDKRRMMGNNGLLYLNEYANKEKSIAQYLNVLREAIKG